MTINQIVNLEEKLINAFCLVDDLLGIVQKRSLSYTNAGRKPKLSLSEIITLALFQYMSGFKDIKSYYRNLASFQKHLFPDLPAYKNFIVQINDYALIALQLLAICLWINRARHQNAVYYVDSTDLPVCKNKRIHSHKVCKLLAQIGHSSKGWFFGFKLHAVCDRRGNLIRIVITPGNVDDRAPLEKLCKKLQGILIGDAGYLSQELRQRFSLKGIFLFTAARKSMKKMMTKAEHLMLKSRQIIETGFDLLKNRLALVSSLPRSIKGHFARYIYNLLAYCILRTESYLMIS